MNGLSRTLWSAALALLCLLVLPASPAGAGERIELIELQHRPATEIIPLLNPLLEPGEGISGNGYRLILKARPERLAELRDLVANLDQAPKRLRFSVRRASRSEIEREAARIRGRIEVENGDVRASASGRIHGTQRRLRAEDFYTVTGLEGMPVHIQAGVEFPTGTVLPYVTPGGVAAVPGVEYKSATSGFYARAFVNGDRVRVEIAPRREVLSPAGGGRIDKAALITTVQGRLSEWLELGGTGESRTAQGKGIVHSTAEKGRQRDRLWLKVEVLPD